MLNDLLQEITVPADSLLLSKDIELPDVGDIILDTPQREGKDIFHTQQRDQSVIVGL